MERKNKYVDPDKAYVVHPDITMAYLNYTGDGDTFKQVFADREQKLEDGERYHNPDHDIEMAQSAERLYLQAVMGGWKWPQRKKR